MVQELIVHADDFGLSLEQSQAILACSATCGGTGALNSTSAIVTSPAFGACADLIRPWVDQGAIKLGLHLNLVEGAPCAPLEEVPLLVNERGVFRYGFAGLLGATLRAKPSSDLIAQLYVEVRCQLCAFLQEFPQMRGALRVDSHQHFHMIPAVFDALLDAVEQEGCTLEYLRVPAEPVGPFLATPALYAAYPPVNWVKNGLLNALWSTNKGKLAAFGLEYSQVSAVFCGLVLSGCMEQVTKAGLLEKFQQEADRRRMPLEVLFHPGGMKQAGDCLDPELEGFVAFYLSEHRQLEARAVQGLA